MSNETAAVTPQEPQRRAFFLRILAGIGGGIALGSLLPRFLRAATVPPRTDPAPRVTIHPMAVPRSKKD